MRTWADLRVSAEPGRGARWLLLVLAVVLAHGWLIDRLGQRAPAVATRDMPIGSLPRALPLHTLRTPRPLAAAMASAEPAPTTTAAAQPVAAAPTPKLPQRQAGGMAATAAPEPVATAAPAIDPHAGAPTAAVAETPGAAAGEPPPVYATRMPAPALLRYALSYHGVAGEATLTWQTDGQQYLLRLDGRRGGQALVEQASRGGFDPAGLAPERFTDRRRSRAWQAANFQRESGRIAFSGPAVQHPAWPGAQDRLGWIVQLAAIASATSEPLGAVSVFVVDAHGHGELWTFHSLGPATLDTPLGMLATLYLRRDAPGPESLQVEAWLDPARGHWPAALRFTAPRRRDVFELRLAAEPGLPP